MKRRDYILSIFWLLMFSGLLVSCEMRPIKKTTQPVKSPLNIRVEAENFTDSALPITVLSDRINSPSSGWIALDVPIPVAGRYRAAVRLSSEGSEGASCWIEDYVDNQDGRTYNITGTMELPASSAMEIVSREGSPLNAGTHHMKLHFSSPVNIDWVQFTLMKEQVLTPLTMTQQTAGTDWKLVWSDEFEGTEVDTSKWTYDFGDWGWGNNELQYYTQYRQENARIEHGNLVIEARKDDQGAAWTSARLTTRGKVSFLYGKIEFRAKVPPKRGNWAAGWTLGDAYVDELSWPYCGEIDIMESVGYEMDDATGDGIAHASAHCRAYYFKLGNQPTSTLPVKNMYEDYHTYAVEWTPEGIKAFVDDQHYFTYEDTTSDWAWPFSKPQNIILNLAMGGGWGGAHGMDADMRSQKMLIDYVRVYERP